MQGRKFIYNIPSTSSRPSLIAKTQNVSRHCPRLRTAMFTEQKDNEELLSYLAQLQELGEFTEIGKQRTRGKKEGGVYSRDICGDEE